MSASQGMPNRPNILWISFEDCSPRYGCYGDPVAQTPNLDRFASQGALYTNCFATAGVCAPARSAIITGLYPISTGTHHMRTTHTDKRAPELPTPYDAVIPHYARPIPEYFRAAGYFCTNCAKTDYQFAPPITCWDQQGADAHWRNRTNPHQPFFAVFNLNDTHESSWWDKGKPLRTDPDTVTLPPYLPDTRKCRESLARQYDNIEDNDQRFGELLAQLEEDGLAENTIVFHWSDHGEGLPRAKRWPYDEGIRVPMIVRWPGEIQGGTVLDRLVSTLDLGPTILSLAGLDLPLHLHGEPFLGPRETQRDYVFASRDRYDLSYDMVRAARDNKFKYIRNFHPEKPRLVWVPYRNRHPVMEELYRLQLEGALEWPQTILFETSRSPEELYDIENDPFELTNLASHPEHQETLARMRDACEEWRTGVGDLGEIPESEMVRSMYPDGQKPKTASPLIIPLTKDAPGVEAVKDGEILNAPCALDFYCATQGAGIAYTMEDGHDCQWKLYTGPVRLPEGKTVIRARAIRIGYLESDETRAELQVI